MKDLLDVLKDGPYTVVVDTDDNKVRLLAVGEDLYDKELAVWYADTVEQLDLQTERAETLRVALRELLERAHRTADIVGWYWYQDERVWCEYGTIDGMAYIWYPYPPHGWVDPTDVHVDSLEPCVSRPATDKEREFARAAEKLAEIFKDLKLADR